MRNIGTTTTTATTKTTKTIELRIGLGLLKGQCPTQYCWVVELTIREQIIDKGEIPTILCAAKSSQKSLSHPKLH